MGGKGPLADIVIVDLSRVLAGPFCTLVLSDLGARVIKVELPGRGDDARQFGPFVGGASAYFASLNRGKESIALDLDAAADRGVFDRLLARADVLVENFRPGALDRKGYGWDALAARFPRLIYASISGFGRTGPYRDRAAYDLVVQALSGMMSLTGEPGGPPTRAGTSIGDITAGLFMAAGIAAALFRRATTGRGSQIDVGMLDCQVAILENALVRYAATGVVPGRSGSHHASIAPFGMFRAGDGPIVITAGNDRLFAQLCAAIGRPALATDPRFATNQARTEHRAELIEVLEAVLTAGPVQHWLERLGAAGVPCAPINTIAQVVADPQIAARRMLVHASSGAGQVLATGGNPIKFADVADPPERPGAPTLDADRRAILRELGLTDP